MKKLKIFNGSDWNYQGGHIYVAGYSQQDAVNLINEAYRKVHNFIDRPDICPIKLGYFREYFSKDCWGNSMKGITPKRGVWHTKAQWDKPERII